jgi:hypothetical protein
MTRTGRREPTDRPLFDKKGSVAMAETSYGLQMNRLAAWALNAFPPKDRARIRSTLGHLIGPTALEELGARVRHLPTDEPLYSLRVPPDIRIIFSRRGDMTTIVDILRQGAIEAFAASSAPEIPVDEPSSQTEPHRGSRRGRRKVGQTE